MSPVPRMVLGVVALFAALPSVLLHGQAALPVEGAFLEPLSQISFPTEFHGWVRYRVLRYPPPAGHSVTYDIKAEGKVAAIATAYVYPHGSIWPEEPRAHFRSTLEELLAMDSTSEVVREQLLRAGGPDCCETWLGTVIVPRGRNGTNRPVIAVLTVARARNYWFKWRVDVLASATKQVMEQVQDLVLSLGPK